MRIRMAHRSLILIAAIALLVLTMQACGQKPLPQESCNFVQNSDRQRVSWGAETPVTFYIDPSFPKAYYGAVQAAADHWNNAIGRALIRIGGVTGSAGAPAQDNVNVIYWMTAWDTAQTSEQARTTIYWSGVRIYEADLRINARDHDFFWKAEPVPGALDVESLLVHEFGHGLGLAHANATGSVMVKSLAAASGPNFVDRRSPSLFDVNSIRCEY